MNWRNATFEAWLCMALKTGHFQSRCEISWKFGNVVEKDREHHL